MAGWLSRATDAFRKPAAAPPEPFAVRCDCGGTVAGERVSAAQKPACPRCGTSVFVLPLNVYPAPPRPAPPNAVGTAKPDATKPAKPDTSATVTAPREAAASTRKTQSSPKAKPGLREPVAAQVQPAAAAPNGILVDAPSRMLTPFRLIVVVIGAIGMVTAWGLWHRQRVEFAKASVQAAAEAGLAALKDGNFAAAARDLSRARDAVDLLRRTDPESHTIRRHCREAVAGYELSGSSLFELLAGYAAEVRQGKAASRRSMSR